MKTKIVSSFLYSQKKLITEALISNNIQFGIFEFDRGFNILVDETQLLVARDICTQVETETRSFNNHGGNNPSFYEAYTEKMSKKKR